MLFFVLIILLVLAALWYMYNRHITTNKDNSDLSVPDEEEWLGNSTIFRTDIKMLSYNDALEESKQFIYNIAKIVVQRFAPDQKNSVLQLGKKLLAAGVKYVHVVDIFALSLEKKKSKIKNLQDKKSQSTPSRQ